MLNFRHSYCIFTMIMDRIRIYWINDYDNNLPNDYTFF